MEIALIVGWLVAGLIGGVLIWLDWMFEIEGGVDCPTPRAIALVLIFSTAGLFILGGGMAVSLLGYIARKDWSDSWWTRPICERDQ